MTLENTLWEGMNTDTADGKGNVQTKGNELNEECGGEGGDEDLLVPGTTYDSLNSRTRVCAYF